MYRVKTIPKEMLISFFASVDVDKLILRFIWKYESLEYPK